MSGFPDEEPEAEDQPTDWYALHKLLWNHCGFCGVEGHTKDGCPAKTDIVASNGKRRTKKGARK